MMTQCSAVQELQSRMGCSPTGLSPCSCTKYCLHIIWRLPVIHLVLSYKNLRWNDYLLASTVR